MVKRTESHGQNGENICCRTPRIGGQRPRSRAPGERIQKPGDARSHAARSDGRGGRDQLFLARTTGDRDLSGRARSAGLRQTTISRSSSFSKICGCKTTSSVPRTKPARGSSCFSAAHASIRNTRRNRFRRSRCSPACWNRPTRRMRSRRSLGSSSARPTRGSMAQISFPRCRRICTGLTTISIFSPRTFCRRCCGRRTKRK